MNTTTIEEYKKQLKEKGYVILKNLYDHKFVEDLYINFLKRVEAGIATGGKFGKRVETDFVIYVDHPFTLHKNAVLYAINPVLIELVKDYLGEKIAVSYTESYRTKPLTSEFQRKVYDTPGVFSGWHSDANMISENRGYRCLVAMLYLNDVDESMGPLELIEGSHLFGGRKRPWDESEIQNYDKSRIVVTMPRGSVVLFDMEMVHRAGIPTSKSRDVFRVMFSPSEGYRENLIFSNETLPNNLSSVEQEILNFGRYNSTTISLSPKSKYNEKVPLPDKILRSKSGDYITRFLSKLGFKFNHSYKQYDNGYRK